MLNKMIRASTQNIRSKVDKRQIVQYLTLRQRILHQKIAQPTKGEDIKTLKKRQSEVMMLISLIRMDTIDNKIRGMHQYIHRQNEYLKTQKSDGIQKAEVPFVGDKYGKK